MAAALKQKPFTKVKEVKRKIENMEFYRKINTFLIFDRRADIEHVFEMKITKKRTKQMHITAVK